MTSFSDWRPSGLPDGVTFDIGLVVHGLDGSLRVELLRPHDKRLAATVVFLAPLAVRTASEGSLLEYWRAGLVVRNTNLFVLRESELLAWLERSSGGVHSVDRVTHYAIFSDDLCVEVLSTEAPDILLTDPAEFSED